MIEKDRCSGCGGCEAICPVNAISMGIDKELDFTPNIDDSLCIKCGLCRKVCPSLDEEYLTHLLALKGDDVLGNVVQCYAGHAIQKEFLRNSQSGGFVGSLLTYCLENDIADAALVCRWSDDDPFVPTSYLATNQDEVLKSGGSIYSSVPILTALKDVRPTTRVVVVGLPCHIHAIRTLQKLQPSRFHNIVFCVGLYCLGVFQYRFYDYLLTVLGLCRNQIDRFQHRYKPHGFWPYKARIKIKDGNCIYVDGEVSRTGPRDAFTRPQCFRCPDKANNLADISCGDCRIARAHYEFSHNKNYNIQWGLSEFIVRNDYAMKIVNDFLEHSFEAIKVTPNEVRRSLRIDEKHKVVKSYISEHT